MVTAFLTLHRLFAYAAGIPLFALFVLNGIKGNLEEWRTRFGFLFSSFEPECWYWEVVEVSKKGILFVRTCSLLVFPTAFC